jgi:hypothetical protein
MFRFCWHDWSPWKTYAWVGVQYGTAGYLLTGDTAPRKVSKTMQTRVCTKCGKELHRTVAEAAGATYANPNPLKTS